MLLFSTYSIIKIVYTEHIQENSTKFHVGTSAAVGPRQVIRGVQLHVLSSGVGVWVGRWVYNWTTWIPNIMDYGKQITLLLQHKHYIYTALGVDILILINYNKS
jgi:hypothetical protein